MSKFNAGMDEAVAMLKLLQGKERESLLKTMMSQNPELTQKIQEELKKKSFDLAQLLTTPMTELQSVFGEIDRYQLGLALKTLDEERVQIWLEKLPKTLRADINEGFMVGLIDTQKIDEAVARSCAYLADKLSQQE